MRLTQPFIFIEPEAGKENGVTDFKQTKPQGQKNFPKKTIYCFEISRRENRWVEQLKSQWNVVPYGTKQNLLNIDSTHILFLTEQ